MSTTHAIKKYLKAFENIFQYCKLVKASVVYRFIHIFGPTLEIDISQFRDACS